MESAEPSRPLLRTLKTETFANASNVTLIGAVQTFLAGPVANTRRLISLTFVTLGSTYAAFLVYTE